MAICAPADAAFATLVTTLGRPELAVDERFAELTSRVANRDELTAVLDTTLAGRTRSEGVEQLQRAGIPAGPVRTVPEALESAQASARRMVLEVEGGRLRIPGHPFHLSSLDDSPTRPPAGALDEHGEALRAEFLGDASG